MIKMFSPLAYTEKRLSPVFIPTFLALPLTKYKINLVRVLIYRAFHICSSYHNFHEGIVRIKKIMSDNCFPKSLIDRIIKNFLDRQFGPGSLIKPDNKIILLFCIPYLEQYSLQIKTRLNRIIKQCYPNIQLKVIFWSPKRIGSLFPFKDRFPTLMPSSVIYKFQCPGCHALYYGKTSRNLITRCREHLGVNKAGFKIKVAHLPLETISTNQGTQRRLKTSLFWTEPTMSLIYSFMKA